MTDQTPCASYRARLQWLDRRHFFVPDGTREWMKSHASNPVPFRLRDGSTRVYFSTRDASNRSSVAFCDFSRDENELQRICGTPVLKPGEPGLFDDSGISLGCIVPYRGTHFLYYVGWNLGVTVPWRNSIGLAVGNPETGVFEKERRAPVMDRSEEDPFSLSYPYVMEENGVLRMWYGSHLTWGSSIADMRHVIKYAESEDGVAWKREGRICIPVEYDEIGVSRPFVRKRGDTYQMWYSLRAAKYRIGYAESSDGISWKRIDGDQGLGPSGSGWDGEEVCYPYLHEDVSQTLLFYCGNGYGKTGFGVARGTFEHT